MSDELAFLRTKIDMLDDRIVDLLAKRALVVERVAEVKRRERLLGYDAAREKTILSNAWRAYRGYLARVGLSPDDGLRRVAFELVFQTIVRTHRDLVIERTRGEV